MKKDKVKNYAKALAELILKEHSAKDEKKIIEGFLKAILKSGLEKKAKEIVILAESIVLEKQGKRRIVFETARKIDSNHKKVLQKIIKDGDIVKDRVNPELIAGIKIIINDSKQFDASMQRKLQNIF